MKEESQQIFRDDGILLSGGERSGLCNNEFGVHFEAIGVTVRTDVDLGSDNRITSHAHLVECGIANDTTCSFSTLG